MTKRQSTIVVINDDPIQLHLIARVLETAGHKIREYVDSAEALDSLTSDPHVDLFVVDLHMPGIDGWKVCRLLRSPDFRAYNETPILVVSATFMGADVEAITADIGADGFVPMPFEKDELLGHTRDLLAGVRPQKRSDALLVEDNDAVARAVSRTFTANGYEIHRAHSLAEAQKMWGKVNPDLVLLDYHLPDGVAPELLRKLQFSASDRTVVLVMTGDTDPALPVQILQYGADAYVRKPFDPGFLLQLAGKARRERSLLRVEALLEVRTQELRRSEARYRTLFEAIPDFVITVDGMNEVVGANRVATEALGPTTPELRHRPVAELVADEEQAEQVRQALDEVRSNGSGRFETELVGPDERSWTLEITGSAPKDADVGSVLLVGRDLTERRLAEEERRRLDAQVQHAQRLESLGVLAGGIAHDFNNLLVGVMGNASLALSEVSKDSSVHECLTQIETAARRAAELTAQILTFSGKGESAMAPQDVSGVVSEMGQLLTPAVSTNAKIVYDLGPELPAVRADASQLRQVIMNLIMNASEALGDGLGTIEIKTSLVHPGPCLVSDNCFGELEPGPHVAIEVRDDGCGMDTETLRQVFDPFFSTKFTGRGLGLAATLGIVRAHSGVVAVDSAPGKGTTFRVLLPALGHRAPTDGTPSEEANSDLSGTGKTILVVDDEPSVRMLATNAMVRAGFEVYEAASGGEALQLLDAVPWIDLVVLDVTMPALKGTEVLQQIRTRRATLPVILSSGYTDEALPEGTIQPGITTFLRKPYSPSGLLDGVAQMLRAAYPSARRADGLLTEAAKDWRASV